MTWQALPFIVLLGFFYGSTLVVSRFSVGQWAPSTYIGLRLTLAALAHVLIYAAMRSRQWPRNGRVWRHAVLFGVLGTAVPMVCIVTGLQYLSSGLASIVITTNPAFTVLLAHFFLADEKLNLRKVLGVALALSGAALLALMGENGLSAEEAASPIGYILLTTAMLFGSSSTIYARKYMSDMDSFDVASIRMVSAAAAVLPLSVLLVGFDTTAVDQFGLAALFYAALVGTFGGLLLAFYNIKHFGATASAMTSYVIPVVASIGGALFLGEIITVGMLVGMAFIAVGIGLINERKKRTAETKKTVEPVLNRPDIPAGD
ncbi:MAG: DMT family transporter [Anaerolineales bacterium]|nr:DMT family transporter [Anaerolineales bacterium]